LPIPVEIEITKNPMAAEAYFCWLSARAAKNRLSFLQVESNDRCSCSENPPWISGPSSLAMASRINSPTGSLSELGRVIDVSNDLAAEQPQVVAVQVAGLA
jgi:hypothetical protein